MVSYTLNDKLCLEKAQIRCFYPLSLKIQLPQPSFFLSQTDNAIIQDHETKVFHAYLFSSQT